MHNKGRGLIDFIFSIVIIFILSGIFTVYWVLNLREARSVALENQLTNLKYSLELYRILEGQYPQDLRDLNKKCKASEEDSLCGKSYLEHQMQDKEGYPVDPYSRRFIYDNKTGKITTGGVK
ncbi:MAG: type II secretion system protein GspG [Candidatus Omnitrophica bacterium]|nr:type II secretion system protein GspG [Candidatus Omnitrophota bacterium]MBU1853801.1 type II secretion system protein GspG [Candidatus Omnitrophota bacterium]